MPATLPPSHHISLLFVIHTLNCTYTHTHCLSLSLCKGSAGLSSINKRPAVALSMTMALRSACVPHIASWPTRETRPGFTFRTSTKNAYFLIGTPPASSFKSFYLQISRQDFSPSLQSTVVPFSQSLRC